MKQLALDSVPSGNYVHGSRADGEIGALNQWRVGPEAPSHGNSAFRAHHYHHQQRSEIDHHHESMSSANRNVMSGRVDRGNGEAKTLGSHQQEQQPQPQQQERINGASIRWQSQTTPPLSGFPSESLYGTTATAGRPEQAPQHLDRVAGQQRTHEADTKYTQRTSTGVGPNTAASEASRPKLRWQAREPDSPDDELHDAPGAAFSEGNGVGHVVGHGHDWALSQDDGEKNCVGYGSRDDLPAEYGADRSWRGLTGRRGSIGEDRRLDERVVAAPGQQQQPPPQQQQQLVRSPSEEDSDMYDHPASVGEYEPSETSSTTVEEMDNNDGSVVVPPGRALYGDHHPGGGRHSPPQDLAAAAIARSGARPNLPRSNASSGRSTISEDSFSFSPHTEPVASPDAPLPGRSRMAGAARRHSWDERASRLAAASPSSRPLHHATSVRRKGSFADYGSHPSEHIYRVSSEPVGHVGAELFSQQGSALPSMAASPLRHSPQGYQNQQWGNSTNRYAPASLPGQRSPSYPGSANSSSRHCLAEHPSQARTAGLVRYPPLPLPGTLPHVDCRHCRTLLMVPGNLAPFKKSTQKLRCGSCRKISIFSVPFEEVVDSGAVSGSSFGSGRSDSHGSTPLLRAGSDVRADSLPSGRPSMQSSPSTTAASPAGGGTRSGRSNSVSEINVGHVHMPPLPRKHSLGNEELKAIAEQEMAERAFSERAVDSSYPTPGSSLRSTISATSESFVTSNFSDAGPSDLSNEFHNPPASGTAHESGGGHDPRFMKKGHGHGAGSAGFDEKLTSSDSESDQQRSHLATGSPQLTQSGSRSSDSISPPVPDGRSSGHHHQRTRSDLAAAEQAHDARSSLRGLRGIFGSRRNRLQSGAHYKRRVVVNGVPIPDHLVKKAEQQAGPLHPGTYWYDWQAGFWGVDGAQCMGIIPPFIEEFNHPLSRDCSGGRTGILVNGRELHHVDRDKLSSRGLPNIPGMSYRVEIDGRVVDDAAGTELRSLGRLAPSVEAKGRGMGMYLPSSMGGGSRS